MRVGSKVTNKRDEHGIVIEINDYIKVDFGDRVAQFQADAFVKGFLIPEDAAEKAEIEKEIENIKAEESRRAEEKRIAEAKAAEERAKRAAEYEESKKTITKSKKAIKLEDMFGSDYHIEHLRRHPILPYQEVEKQFGIRISGFGRGINITADSIVLISSMEKKGGSFVYHDHWTLEGDYIYSGEGKTGDQQLIKGNKAVVDAETNGKSIYLFVKLSPQEYYFQGKFALVDYTYENEKEEDGNVRNEYKFRLRKIADPINK